MKKILAVLLACAMFLPILASCGTMQAGELDLTVYDAQGNVQNVADLKEVTGYVGDITLDSNASKYTGRNSWAEMQATWWGSTNAGEMGVAIEEYEGDLGVDISKYAGYKVYTIDSAKKFASFLSLLRTPAVARTEGDVLPEALTAAGYTNSTLKKKPQYDFSKAYIIITCDLDMSEFEQIYRNEKRGNDYKPGGSQPQNYLNQAINIVNDGTLYFNGVLDGQGHVIKGYSISCWDNGYSFLGPLVDATIKNVAFVDGTVDAYAGKYVWEGDTPVEQPARRTAAMISPWTAGSVMFDNVYVSGRILGGTGNMGAIVGQVKAGGSLTIQNSTVDITYQDDNGVYANNDTIGGMIGYADGAKSVTVSNCKVNCNMTVETSITIKTKEAISDGAQGVKKDSDENEMYKVTEVTAENVNYGGVLAFWNGSATNASLRIQDCEVTGSIAAGGKYVGGVVGRIAGTQGTALLSNVTSHVNLSIGDIVMSEAEAGKAYYNAQEEKYSVADAILGGVDYMGGILGAKESNGGLVMADCFNYGTVSGGGNVGGMIGFKGNSCNFEFSLTRCENHGNVTAVDQYAGGLIGQVTQTTNTGITPTVFSYCVNAAEIRGTNYVAGLIGYDVSDRPWTLEHCMNTGDVSGNKFVAGLVSSIGNSIAADEAKVIDSCENNADIRGEDEYVGGLVGTHKCKGVTISNSTNRGTVYGKANYGGIFGGIDAANTPVLSITNAHNYANVRGASGYVGGIIGQYSGTELNITNSSNNGVVTGKGSGVGGILGITKGTTVVTITGTQNNGAVSNNNSFVGGFIGAIGTAKSDGAATATKVTIENSANNADVTATGKSNIAGFVGWCNTTELLSITNSENHGAISGGSLIGGFVGSTRVNTLIANKVSISRSTNTGSVTGTGNGVGGFVGYYIGSTLDLDQCYNRGAVTGTTHSGGLLGYILGYKKDISSITPMNRLTVTNCVSTGTVHARRSSGGMIGYVQHVKDVTVSNCTVAADLNFTIVDSNNPYVGGLAGQICDNGNVIVTGCVVTGSLFATSTCDVKACAAGLVGGVGNRTDNGWFNSSNMTLGEGDYADWEYYGYTEISNCLVSVDFAKVDFSKSNDVMEVFFSNDLSNYSDVEKAHLLTVDGLKYVDIDSDATNTKVPDATEVAKRLTKAVGYQTKDNGDGTTSLRYVFSVKGLTEVDKALGFDVLVEFANGTSREIRVYCPTIYTSIQSGATTYTAEEGEYLFTLIIEDVPNEQIKINGSNSYIKDALVTIRSFTAYNEDARLYGVTKKVGDNTVYGQKHDFDQDNFVAPDDHAALFGAEGVLGLSTTVTVPFNQIEAKSGGLGNSNADLYAWGNNSLSSAHCIQKLKGTDTGEVFHYYFKDKTAYNGTFDASAQNAYINLTFDVPAEGNYQLYFNLRIKNNTTRYSAFQIDDAGLNNRYYMSYSMTDYTQVTDGAYNKDNNADGSNAAYLETDIVVHLTAGRHTITFTMPQTASGVDVEGSSFHFRNLYLVKVAD